MMFDRLIGYALLGLMQLPRSVLKLAAGPPVKLTDHALDSDVQLLLRLLAVVGERPLERLSPPEARADLARWGEMLGVSAPEMAAVRDRMIPGPHGDIRLRIYTPRAARSPLPVLVYYHGGGWVIGGLDTHDAVVRALADRAACVAVAVDYRLAPEHKFPIPLDDAFAAYRWIRGNVLELGGDIERVAVAGDSAGGNLATSVCRLAKLEGVPAPVLQLLVYPVTDASAESPSYEHFAEGFFLTRAGMRWFRDHYLAAAADARDPRVSPLLAEDLEGMPAALLLTAGYDPLHDEGKAYAERLLEAGVDVCYRDWPGLIHGFFSMGDLVVDAGRAFEEAVVALRKAFAPAQ